MPDFRGKISRSTLGALLLLSFLSSQTAFPQTSEKNDPDRQRALELYGQGKMVEAMPLLEKLAAGHPKDVVVMESWGVATLNYSQILTDPELKKKARIRARSILLKAKELGDNSNLLETMLSGLPEDGSASAFSNRKEVDDVMQAAEADFSRGDLDKAREGYIHALLLDPNLYTAALFIGDTYFKQKQPGSAGEWFARAIQIDPNRETAYRYWGDALVDLGKFDEARTKFINAVIAEPYNNNPWMGLGQWADHNHVKLTYLRLQDKSKVTIDGGKTTVTLDSDMLAKKDNAVIGAWLVYGTRRAKWQTEEFKKQFPNEAQYRRTLKEESDSLHTMVIVISEVQKSKKDGDNSDLDPSLTMLVKIDEAGLLDPFVLLNRADNGIAQDYPDYRGANRDRIYRYMDEFVVPKTPEPSPSPQ